MNLSAPSPQYRNTPLSSILEKEGASNPSSCPRGTVFHSLLACGLIFSGQTSSLLFDHPLILSRSSPPKRVPSLPYLAVLALCCQLFQLGSGVSSYAHFCYHSGKMSSHKFGTDGASLLGVEGGKYPKNYQIGNKDLINQEANNTVLKQLLTPLVLIIAEKNKSEIFLFPGEQ